MSYEYEDTARTQLFEFELFPFNTHDLREEGLGVESCRSAGVLVISSLPSGQQHPELHMPVQT